MSIARLALFCCCLALGAAEALAEKRVALVVGNDVYENLSADKQLRNAVNDARTMRATLEELGFEVLYGENLGRRELVDRMFDLRSRIGGDDTVFFFFAGHGVSFGGADYLLPSDIPAPRGTGRAEEGRLAEQAVAEAALLEYLTESGARVAVVVLDACRNNPLQSTDRRSIGATRGLVQVQPPKGVFSIYSAGRGQEALDRLGPDDSHPNSVFTRVFVDKLKTPGLDLKAVVTETRRAVAALAGEVGHDQFVGYYDQMLHGDIYLAGLKADEGLSEARAAVPDPKDPTPAKMIREVYEKLERDQDFQNHNPANVENRELAQSFFTPEFIRLLEMNNMCWDRFPDKEGVQIWVAGSDYTVTDVRIDVTEATADTQTVTAEIKNFDEDQVWRFKFRHYGGKWLVEDIGTEWAPSLGAEIKACLG